MTTANESQKSVMTSEAYDLLDCFVAGLDDVIYEIAEGIAREKGRVSSDGTVEIQKDDIRDAAELALNAIRDQAGKAIPKGAAEQIERMHGCVLEKCRVQDAGE